LSGKKHGISSTRFREGTVLSLFLLWRYHENFAGLVRDAAPHLNSLRQHVTATAGIATH
jgi:hypothetical protein